MGIANLEAARALLREPAFAAMAINAVIGLLALLLRLFGGPFYRRRALRAVQQVQPMLELASVAATTSPDGPLPAHRPPIERLKEQAGPLNGSVSGAPPRWLSACAGFHLLNAVIFALILLPRLATNNADQSVTSAAPSLDATSLLLVVCVLVSLSALLLANLAERLTVPAASSRRPPLLPTAIMIGVVEAIFFALDRADIGYLVAEGVWLVSCIMMTARLLRLKPQIGTSSAGRSFTLATAIGFFARALLTLLGMLQVISLLLPPGNVFTFESLGGVIAEVLASASLLKAICTAWTGAGLLLMAGVWRQGAT